CFRFAVVASLSLHDALPILVFKGKIAFMSNDFINQVFQSGLDKTFVVETRPNPLNPLSADEIKTAVEIIRQSEHYKPGFRFTERSEEHTSELQSRENLVGRL